MDATELLTQDHEKVRKLLKELAETSGRATKSRTELLQKIALELKVHTTTEEQIVYPAFRQARDDSEKFSGRAKVLKELVEHHADEEEEEMFKRARKIFPDDELEALGEQLEARKKELMQELAPRRKAG
jgi:hemerythrin superfamily protein